MSEIHSMSHTKNLQTFIHSALRANKRQNRNARSNKDSVDQNQVYVMYLYRDPLGKPNMYKPKESKKTKRNKLSPFSTRAV